MRAAQARFMRSLPYIKSNRAFHEVDNVCVIATRSIPVAIYTADYSWKQFERRDLAGGPVYVINLPSTADAPTGTLRTQTLDQKRTGLLASPLPAVQTLCRETWISPERDY